jgi:hypothetical protein
VQSLYGLLQIERVVPISDRLDLLSEVVSVSDRVWCSGGESVAVDDLFDDFVRKIG